jgi:hypothetical protein
MLDSRTSGALLGQRKLLRLFVVGHYHVRMWSFVTSTSNTMEKMAQLRPDVFMSTPESVATRILLLVASNLLRRKFKLLSGLYTAEHQFVFLVKLYNA